MSDEWTGTEWSEEKEQAFDDGCALRVLNCPRKRCRRMRACGAGGTSRSCRSPERYALDPEAEWAQFLALRKVLTRRVNMTGEEQDIAEAAWVVAAERRRRLAFERAKKVLRREKA